MPKASQKRIDKGMYWDRAWSLVEGCLKVSPGCLNCWSEKQAAMRVHNPNVAQRHAGTIEDGKFNGVINLQWNDINKPTPRQKPQVWAIWNDLFHTAVTWNFIYKAYERMALCPQHTFLILTKRPEAIQDCDCDIEFHLKRNYPNLKWPLPNVYLGVTAENQEQADKRIPILLQIPAAVRFVSVEPMLEVIDLTEHYYTGDRSTNLLTGMPFDWEYEEEVPEDRGDHLDWVICGAESGPGRRPMSLYMARSLRDQCVDAGTPFFLKQMEVNGKLVKMPELDGRTWDQFPETIKEFPKTV